MSAEAEVPLAWVSSRASSPELVRRRSVACRCDGLIRIIDAMQAGDELRTFRTPKSSNAREGRRGYVVVREGSVAATFVTARG